MRKKDPRGNAQGSSHHSEAQAFKVASARLTVPFLWAAQAALRDCAALPRRVATQRRCRELF
jgi:hypothetical protein